MSSGGEIACTKDGVHSGHVQKGIRDPFCFVKNEKGKCQDGYTKEVTGPDGVRVLVATKAKPNQHSNSLLDREFFISFLDVLNLPQHAGRNYWQYKTLLVHLYSYFDALPLAYEWYKTLDIKNILLETVWHYIVPQMLLSVNWVDLAEVLQGYLSFMEGHFADSTNFTFLAYRHRNYTKAVEFVQFRERLEHSHQYLMSKLESSILKIKQKADNIDEVQSVLESSNCGIELLELCEERCKSLTFNDDTQSRPWWTPTPDANHLTGEYHEDAVSGIRETKNVYVVGGHTSYGEKDLGNLFSVPSNKFEHLGIKPEGFSGSDIAVCVKDVLFEPVRKTQDAMYFINTENDMWVPCGPKRGAIQTTMQDLATKGLAAKGL